MADTTQTIRMPLSTAMKDVTIRVTVTGLKIFRLRLSLGALLVKAGAAIIGGRSTISIERPRE